MVYDITNEQSFISCRDNWLPNIKSNACPPPTLSVILANKLDLDSDRAIRVAQGLELANEKNSLFMEVSAKSGDNVENLLYTIGTQLIHMHQQRSQH
jgi:GTPase SAR1 family protein